MQNFLRVNRTNPCPICGKTSWCLVSADKSAVICPRTPSEKEINGRGGSWVGYLHVLRSNRILVRPLPKPKPVKTEPTPDFSVLWLKYRQNMTERMYQELSGRLGLSVSALQRMDVGYDGRNWTFPMRNAEGRCIGIRLRSPNGDKFSVKGSQNGLFIPYLDPKTPMPYRLFIVEGATDCAALLDIGLYGIGRAACMGQEQMIVQFLRRIGRREVVIIADNDPDKTRPDGSTFNPGKDGAKRLAQIILPYCARLAVIWPPATKDVRDWKKNGLTAQILDAIIRNTHWRLPPMRLATIEYKVQICESGEQGRGFVERQQGSNPIGYHSDRQWVDGEERMTDGLRISRQGQTCSCVPVSDLSTKRGLDVAGAC